MVKHKILWDEHMVNQLKGLMKLDPKRTDVANILDVSPQALDRFIRKRFSMTFSEFREVNMAGVRNKLIKTALEQAFTGKNNTMLIFCLKNLCQWTDKHQISGDTRAPLVLKYKLDDL